MKTIIAAAARATYLERTPTAAAPQRIPPGTPVPASSQPMLSSARRPRAAPRFLRAHPAKVLHTYLAFRRAMARQFPSRLFFFFPFYHIGGAEVVHSRIVAAVADAHPVVFITNYSRDRSFLDTFKTSSTLFDIPQLCERSRVRPLALRLIADHLNRLNRRGPVTVFGCNSLFFYDLLPLLDSSIRKCDLIHAFVGSGELGAEHFSLPVSGLLDARVFISQLAVTQLRNQYAEHGGDSSLMDRVVWIENCTPVPAHLSPRHSTPFTVLYAGRGSGEKRIHLMARMARECRSAGAQFDFILVGPSLERSVPKDLRGYCRFTGPLERADLDEMYKRAHVVLLTSSREGFPLTLMEGMAFGCVPVTTCAGDIGRHITHGDNGFLIQGQDEDAIVRSAVSILTGLSANRLEYERLSARAFHYAALHFSADRFRAAYRQLLLGESSAASPASPASRPDR